MYTIKVDLSKKSERCAEEIYKKLKRLPEEIQKNLQTLVSDFPLTRNIFPSEEYRTSIDDSD